MDACLIRMGEKMVQLGSQGGAWTFLTRLIRRATLTIALVTVASMTLVWAACRWVGEQNPTTAFLLFVPPSVWWIPAALLAPVTLLIDRRAFLALLFAALLPVWMWVDWRPQFSSSKNEGHAKEESLTVLTYNRGQHMNQSLQPFKNAMAPDLLMLQDAAHRAAGYAASPEYAEFPHALSCGEHTLLSRHAILGAELLFSPDQPKRAIAAHFTIDWNDQAVSLYSVHLQTPRDVLGSMSRGGFLWGLLGVPGTPWAEKRKHYQAFWDGQIADSKAILEAAAADPNPVILAGDFNSPSLGYIHRMITNDWNDAHEEAGSGFGFTFPGVTGNPLSLGGPWMRIDYIFFSSQWEARACVTEAKRPSQHRAVAATLKLK